MQLYKVANMNSIFLPFICFPIDFENSNQCCIRTTNRQMQTKIQCHKKKEKNPHIESFCWHFRYELPWCSAATGYSFLEKRVRATYGVPTVRSEQYGKATSNLKSFFYFENMSAEAD